MCNGHTFMELIHLHPDMETDLDKQSAAQFHPCPWSLANLNI